MKSNLLVVLGMSACIFGGCSKERRSAEAAREMQQFVIDLSEYARAQSLGFLIVPQNGSELAFIDADADNNLNTDYLRAIDGFGIEELFYNGGYSPDEERLDMLRTLHPEKPIFVSEFASSESAIADAIQRNQSEGFVCFPRSANNYDYTHIPDSAIQENSDNITSLEQARNYLYLISHDAFSSKQEMIGALVATNFDVILIDLFYEDDAFTSSEINQLKTKANGGSRLVLSYISVGSAEKYRYYWKKGWGLHHPLWLRRRYDGYSDEFWVKFWKDDWKNIMYGNDDSYIKKIIHAGFDGAYLDNVEAYYFLYYKD